MAIVMMVLLAAHLLCMNISSAAPLLCVWFADIRCATRSEADREMAQLLAVSSIGMLFLGITLGLANGTISFLLGDRSLLETLPHFQRKIFWGILELICSFVWMLAYSAWLKWRPPRQRIAAFLHGTLAVMSATNLLYHFPPLMSVMSKVANGEISVSGDVDAGTFRSLAFTPNVMALTLHFAWASLAVTGMFLFWLARNQEPPEKTKYVTLGARVACIATAFQLPTGLWLLFATPSTTQARLMGGEPLTACLFLGSLIAAFYLLQCLAILSFGEYDRKLVSRSSWLMITTVFLMSATLHLLRSQ